MSEGEMNALLTLFYYIFLNKLNNFSGGRVQIEIEKQIREMRARGEIK